MLQSYQTVAQPGAAELVIKKSRFIGQIASAASPEEAAAFVDEIRQRRHDARHNVWAYVLRDGQRLRYSDDGEPTGGMPALEVLQKEGVADCVAVVTRYFGGVLLGAAGLARAYAGACKAALDAAGIVSMIPTKTLRVKCDYAFFGRLQALVPECGGVVTDTLFGERVAMELRLASEDAGRFQARLTDASAGGVAAEEIWEGFSVAAL